MNKMMIPFLGLILFNSCNIFSQSNWKTYEFKEQQFKIDFIQQPDVVVDTTDFNAALLITHYASVNVTDSLHENLYYSISAESYPPDYIHSDSLFSLVEGFINSSQNDLLEDKDFTLLSSTLIEKYAFPGKSFKWKSDDTDNFIEYQIYLIENTLFQLAVVTKAEKAHNIYINKFFNSFDLLDYKRGNYSIPKISEKSSFEIDFPGQPSDQSQTVDSEYGKLQLNIQVYEPAEKSKNMAFVAMETKYPMAVADQNDPYALNSFYKKSIDGSIATVNGQLISITDIMHQSIPGKEFKCYFSEGKGLLVYRIFYIDNKLYSIGVVSSPENDNNNAMIDFFKSFKISR